jgi:hypothetical protein
MPQNSGTPRLLGSSAGLFSEGGEKITGQKESIHSSLDCSATQKKSKNLFLALNEK